jgi:polar amino acid transport system permease protein
MITVMLNIGPLILDGFIFTVELTLFGIFVGLALGVVLSIGDLYGGIVFSNLIRLYVEFFRGSPILVQLFIFQWALPSLTKIPMNPYTTCFIVFAMNSGAYQKGYIKGAMETVFQDQMMAGLSVGMSRAQTIANVILPQALRIVIPAWTNEFCSLTKSTSAVALIGMFDLTAAGKTIAGLTYQVLEPYLLVAAVYLAWITAFTKIADIVYEKKKIPGIELST